MFKVFDKNPESEEKNEEYTDDDLRAKLSDGLGDDVINYLNSQFLDKTYGTASYSDVQIRSFINSIFNLFSKGNVCFSAGTIVFSDFGKLLFNLLTYNQLKVENGIYLCNNPGKNVRGQDVTSKLVTVNKTHKTHNKVFTSGKGENIACLPTNETKFERSINPPLEGLCDEPTSQDKKSESKSVLLYYPFKAEDDKQLLFFKLERDEIMSIGHVKKGIATYAGNRFDSYFRNSKPVFGVNEIPNQGTDTITGFDMRREDRSPDKNPNECNYSEFFNQKDVEFYRNYYKILGITNPSDEVIQNNIAELEWYNTNIRTGCEFYVTSFLLFDMLKILFVPKQSLTLKHLGGNGKFRSIKKSNKNKNKKVKRSRKVKRNRKVKQSRNVKQSRKVKRSRKMKRSRNVKMTRMCK
tara:strand:- start:685 stop:1911 length:1227 start_codon:yes stop_codon:yes gene_type:complete